MIYNYFYNKYIFFAYFHKERSLVDFFLHSFKNRLRERQDQ